MAKTKKKKRDATKKPEEVKPIATQKNVVKQQKVDQTQPKSDFAALKDNRRWNGQNSGNIKAPVPQAIPATTTKPPHRRVQTTKTPKQRKTYPPKPAQKPNPTATQGSRNRFQNEKVLQNSKNFNVSQISLDPKMDRPDSAKDLSTKPYRNNGAIRKQEQSRVLEIFTTNLPNPTTSSTTTIERSGIGNVLENWTNHPTLLISAGTAGIVLLLCLMGCLCFRWRWFRRFRICRWICDKFSRRKTCRGDSNREHGGNSGENQRLIGSENRPRVAIPGTNIFDDVLGTLASESEERRRQNNEPPKSPWEKNVDNDLKDFEASLKETIKKEERETFERNERLRKLDQELKAKKIEIANMKEKHESASSSFIGNQDELDEMDREFKKRLEEQNRMYAEKLRAMREERARKEKEAAEELNRMRYETQQCIAAVLACVQLRIRFDEKREEWGDSLKKLRQPLITVKNAYYELQDEIKNLDPTDDFLMSCFQKDGDYFARKLEDAQNMLLVAFNNLEQLSMNFEDRIFLRMIMKSCSEQGQVCDSIGYKLVEVLKSPNPKDHLQYLEKEVAELKPHNIPTTGMLTSSAPSASEEEYRVIETVPAPDWMYNLNSTSQR